MKTIDFYCSPFTAIATLCALCCANISFAANPILTNAWATQRAGTKFVDVYYDLTDADSNVLGISAEVSTNSGVTFNVAASSFSGDYGYDVTYGTNRHFTWDAGVDLNGVYTEKLRIKITADDGPVPPWMVKIPAGTFTMGDHYNYPGFNDERPVHEVYISEFLMDKYEVSNENMREVMQWAYNNGKITATWEMVKNLEGSQQSLLALGADTCEISFSADTFSVKRDKTNFPCVEVTWFGALAYCNYRSDIEGLERCIDFSAWSCDWSKNGYRLPTEAEWEKAALGGSVSNHYPWASEGGHYNNHFDGSKANYWASGDPYEGTPRPPTTPCGYYNGNQTPAGIDMANGYGMYDMAGNVFEWCWDWYTNGWYSQPGATNANTHGPPAPDLTGVRVYRGGGWSNHQGYLRCADRNGEPYYAHDYIGIRCVRP